MFTSLTVITNPSRKEGSTIHNINAIIFVYIQLFIVELYIMVYKWMIGPYVWTYN